MVGWSKGGVDSLSLERRSLSKSGKSIGTSLGKEGREGEETCETTSTVEGVADAIADNPAAASWPRDATPAAAATASVAVVVTAAVVTFPRSPKSGESIESYRETTSSFGFNHSGGLPEPPPRTANVVNAASGITARAVSRSRKLVSGTTASPRTDWNTFASNVIVISTS